MRLLKNLTLKINRTKTVGTFVQPAKYHIHQGVPELAAVEDCTRSDPSRVNLTA